MPHPSTIRLLGLVVCAWLPLTGTLPARAGIDPRFFPPAETFRTLQLSTLACGRENTSTDCDRARDQADPLLDHPRLPVSCKDVLWTIYQQAKVAASNSYERRRDIDQAARDLTQFCRQRAMPQEPAQPATPAPGPGGLFRPAGPG